MTTQPIRVIFQGSSSGTFPNLDSAIAFIQSACTNLSGPLDLAIRQSVNETVIEVKPDPDMGVPKGKSMKSPIHVPAGLFDLSW